RDSPRRGLRADRVDELAEPVDDLDLVRLQMPDEVPPERVAVDGVLPLEVLRPVLAHDLDAGLDEGTHLLDPHVLRRDHSRPRVPSLVANTRIALRALGRRQDVHADAPSTSSRAASSSAARPASSPFSFRSRTCLRMSPIRGDSSRPIAIRSEPSI